MAGPSLALKGVMLGWGAFCGTHLFMSHTPVRNWLVDKLGEKGFLSTYSAVAVGTLAPAAYAYLIGRGRGPVVHTLGENTAVNWIGSGLKWMGFFTSVQGMVNPSPISKKAHLHMKKNEDVEVTGIHRITRHPVFAGAAIWGLGCMLQRGRLIDLVFWGGFPFIYLIGGLHQDSRFTDAYPASYWRKTSLIPFGAVVAGEQSVTQAYQEMSSTSLRLTLFAGLLALALRGRLRREFWLPSRQYKAW